MTTTKIDEIIAAAESFAHKFHNHKKFANYTEAEIAKGVAVCHIAINEAIDARREFRNEMPLKEFKTITILHGLTGGDDDEHIVEVANIMLDIICPASEAEASIC